MSQEKIELARDKKRRGDDLERPPSKYKRHEDDTSVSTSFQLTPNHSLSQKNVECHDDYLDNFRAFKSAVINVLSDSEHAHVVYVAGLLNDCHHYSAIYQHLSNIQSQHGKVDEVVNALMSCWPMALGLAYEQHHTNKFNNNVMASHFETDLAHFILQHGSKKVWRQINSNIIKYIKTHYDALADLDDELKEQMIQYKICTEDDFASKNGRDVFMKLLKRRTGVLSNVTEAATLHLVFFNYCHIYQPELSFTDPVKKDEVITERNKKHRQMRPNAIGQMFSQVTRGRERVFSTYRTREFGIRDDYDIVDDDGYLDWHRYEFTPHKYRSTANLRSSIVHRFRSNNIPFIAGPSGTCADCLEGLHFLMPELTEQEKRQYITMLAAAEVGMGHHSFHEVLLAAFNDGLYADLLNNDTDKPVWQRMDYKRSYQALLGDAYRNKRAVHALKIKYPQYFLNDTYSYVDLLEERINSVKQIQNNALANIAYQDLDRGSMWHSSHRINILNIDDINLTTFKQLSRKNISSLIAEISPLNEQEIAFVDSLFRSPITLSHYSEALPEIVNSGRLYSNFQLKNKFTDFIDSSDSDLDSLGNGGFVFFRFELEHDTTKPSRFGPYQICLDGRSSHLLNSGWVSLYDMFIPDEASIVNALTHEKERVRTAELESSYTRDGQFTYLYRNDIQKFDVFATLFYGRDILSGIAYSMVRELRRIGGKYQQERLQALSLSEINDTLAQLFRVEAKIPDRVLLSDENVKVFAPTILIKAIQNANKQKIESLVNLGVDVLMPMTKPFEFYNQDAFELIAQKDIVTTDDIDIFRFLLNYAKATLDKAAFDKKVRALLLYESTHEGTSLLADVLNEFVEAPKPYPRPFIASELLSPLTSSDSSNQPIIETSGEQDEVTVDSPSRFHFRT